MLLSAAEESGFLLKIQNLSSEQDFHALLHLRLPHYTGYKLVSLCCLLNVVKDQKLELQD